MEKKRKKVVWINKKLSEFARNELSTVEERRREREERLLESREDQRQEQAGGAAALAFADA